MAIDPVPWLVGGGAEHSPEVARLFAYAATSGAEGIVTAGDAKVTPLAVPGAGVQVAAGAALIRARSTGGDSQTYVGRVISPETVTIAATGSGAGRSDLIVLQVEDPFMAGEPWQAPTDPRVGPYLRLRVISGVPAGTTRLQDVPAYANRTAITLARVDLPASTGTVTAAMITDLRKLALPRSSRVLRSQAGPTSPNVNNSTTMIRWPDLIHQIDVPEWATWYHVTATLAGVLHTGGNADGAIQAFVGGAAAGGATNIDFDAGTNGTRPTLIVTGSQNVTAAQRGKPLAFELRASRYGTEPGRVSVDAMTHIQFDIQFEERAV